MKFAVVLACLIGATAGGCSTLPTAGPTTGQVVDQAVKDDQQRFDVVDVDDNVVSTLLAQPAESLRTRFQKYGKSPDPKIGIGDTIAVTIWEAAAGGLFGAGITAGVSPGSRSVTIPDQVVARDGAITVPFADRIPIAGKSPIEVQRIIEQRLAEKAIEPQVLVNITKSVTNSATVSGEVVAGARVPLSVNGDHLLDVIALAGGAKAPVYDTFVRLSRDGVTATIPMEKLVSDPAENIYAWPGDVLTLVQVPQTFSVFGATGQNMQVNFGAKEITLAQALAKAGGLQDLRADPAGVFLFRFEPPDVVGALKAAPLAIGPGGSSPVVYRLDLSDANSYFFAQRFPVEDKDVIYVANARLNELQKFFTLLNTITGPVITGIVVKGSVNSSP
ncbi:MAG TPA: polysaccharide biosynthesis/export family protein [Stellaceae bacterium]|nr:polysaccharide biosynthesis/export family protein [Stellaceae bacterium]